MNWPERRGTSNETKDAWFVGFDRELVVVVVWVGAVSLQAIGRTGSRAALPIFAQVMETSAGRCTFRHRISFRRVFRNGQRPCPGRPSPDRGVSRDREKSSSGAMGCHRHCTVRTVRVDGSDELFRITRDIQAP